jgi:hypothetical protein
MKEIAQIKNERSKEMYAWLADVFEEYGTNMVTKLGKIYTF